jgi:hypothetical protein
MELDEQIKALLDEKSKLFVEERKSVIVDIKQKIAIFELTAKDLGFKMPKPEAGDKTEKKGKTSAKAAKKAAKKAVKSSGIYFDLDGKKVPAGRGRPPKEVTLFAAEKGVTTDSLKRNKDGTPFTK